MKNTNNYFKTVEDWKNYAKSKGMSEEEVNGRIQILENDWDEYINQFKAIEGCTVGIMTVNRFRDEYYLPHYYVEYNGCKITPTGYYSDKVHGFQLCEEIDDKGLSSEFYSEQLRTNDIWFRTTTKENNYGQPNNIGKPTANKIQDWIDYLNAGRKQAENEIEIRLKSMDDRIAECVKTFPEAKEVKWENGYWCFSKECNGIKYILEVNSKGEIFEHIDFDYLYKYNLTKCEQAVRLMNNGLSECVYDPETQSYNLPTE